MDILYKVTTSEDKSFSVPNDSRYCLYYKKNDIVEAPKGTIGILLFKNIYYANDFIDIFPGTIKRVRPIGEIRAIHVMANDFSQESLNDFYSTNDPSLWSPPPLGTVVCDKIEVLD